MLGILLARMRSRIAWPTRRSREVGGGKEAPLRLRGACVRSGRGDTLLRQGVQPPDEDGQAQRPMRTSMMGKSTNHHPHCQPDDDRPHQYGNEGHAGADKAKHPQHPQAELHQRREDRQ